MFHANTTVAAHHMKEALRVSIPVDGSLVQCMVPELMRTPTETSPNQTPVDVSKRLGHFVSRSLVQMWFGKATAAANAKANTASGNVTGQEGRAAGGLPSPVSDDLDHHHHDATANAIANEQAQLQAFCQRTLTITKLGLPAVLFCLQAVLGFRQRFPRIVEVHGSSYRLFIVGLLVANKFLDDATVCAR